MESEKRVINATPVKIYEIKKGQTFYEDGPFGLWEYVATCDAWESGKTADDRIQWRLKGILHCEKEETDFLVTQGLEHYGPRLWAAQEATDEAQ